MLVNGVTLGYIIGFIRTKFDRDHDHVGGPKDHFLLFKWLFWSDDVIMSQISKIRHLQNGQYYLSLLI